MDNNLDKEKINILALSWRDIKAPKMGGAEVLSHAMISKLDNTIYNVVHYSPVYKGSLTIENIDGVHYIRKGNLCTVIFHAFVYYLFNHRYISYVIDECNTHRFFTPFYVSRKKRVLFIHQLTREIWDINAKFPLNVIGKKMETPMLRIYRKGKVITVSQSTKNELIELGFDKNKIFIMPNGINIKIKEIMGCNISKENDPTFIYVGRYALYKGIEVCIKAFASIKKKFPKAKLWLVGKENSEFLNSNIAPVLVKEELKIHFCNGTPSCFISKEMCEEDLVKSDVIVWGFVSEKKKYELMKKAHLLLFPSVREGWGIIVTEAGILGTPSLVSNVPGARDAVNYGQAGFLCPNRNPDEFGKYMINIISDKNVYDEMVKNAYAYSITHLWDSKEQNSAIKKLEQNVFI